MKNESIFINIDLDAASETPVDVISTFKNKLRDRDVIIYGTGIVGVTLYRALKYMEIPIKLLVDRNAAEILEVDGFPVCMPDTLKRLDNTGDCVLIVAASLKPAESIIADLKAFGLQINIIENGEKVAQVLQCAICSLRINKYKNIKHAFCSDCCILDNICPSLRKYGMNLIKFKQGEESGLKTKKVTMIGYALGNVCTLNCSHCCESIPLCPKEKRRFVDTKTVIEDIERLASAAEFVTLTEFIGGEPFLHSGLPDIIHSALKIPNAAFIRIFTNGTILPSVELLEALKNPQVAVYISNYTGMLSDKQTELLAKTKQILTENAVSFIYGGYKKWFDFSSFEFRKESDEELSRRFNACFLHNCNRLHKGILYACPHHYAGVTLGIINDDENTVHINDLAGNELAEALNKFKKLPFVNACKYCRMPFDAPMILAGENIIN